MSLAHTVAMARLARVAGHVTPPRRMPRQQYPRLIEAEYGRFLRGVVAAARGAIAGLEHTQTSDEAVAMIEGARRRIAAMVSTLRPTIARIAIRTADHQAAQLDAQTRAVLGVGIDMLGIPRHAHLPASVRMDARRAPSVVPKTVDERVAGFISENVALIKSLGDTPLEQIEQEVTRAFAAGQRHETLARTIVERFGVAEDRAKLIARDQIGKLNGRISADRHQRMGLTRFVWRDVGDQRVRPEHRKLSGTTWAYASPPSEGLPGEPIQCRCHDEPIFDDVLAELDRLEAQGAPLVAPVPPPAAPRRAATIAPTLPPGYYAPGAKLEQGVPAPGKERSRVYVFNPREIAGRLISFPGGVQRSRIERVATATGKNFGPIELVQFPDGRLFVDQGRHRLLQALESGRPVAARIGRAVKGATANGLVPLTSIVPT